MDIGPVRIPSPAYGARRKGPEIKSATTPEREEPPKDRVDISLEARRKLAELAEKARADETLAQGENPEQTEAHLSGNLSGLNRAVSIDEIKQRIDAGYYNRTDVISKIADKLSDEFES